MERPNPLSAILIFIIAFVSCAFADDIDVTVGPSPSLMETALRCLQSPFEAGQGISQLTGTACFDTVHLACINQTGSGTIQERECWIGEFEIWNTIRSDLLQQLSDGVPFWNDEAHSDEISAHLFEADKLWGQLAIESCSFAAMQFEESPLATDVSLSCQAEYEADRAVQYNKWLHG